MSRGAVLACAAALGLFAAGSIAGATSQPDTHAFFPARRNFSENLFLNLHVPPGFKINVFAHDQGNARMMLLLPDGAILATRTDVGEVFVMRDKDGDGVADEIRVVARTPLVHGLARRGDTVYLANERSLFTMALRPSGGFGPLVEFAALPEGGLHPKRTLGFDDAGWLYVSVGSRCNNCFEPNPEHATILRMKPDGSERTVFVRGLRNTLGFDWHPLTHQLWGMDNGSDDRGDTQPPEELNLLHEGADYGWPCCYGKRKVDPVTRIDPLVPPSDCTKTLPLVRQYAAHSAPTAFVFNTGTQFPRSYKDNAFIAFHGSWNRLQPAGYKVVRVRFSHGRPMGFQDFAAGWLVENGQAQFGRPAGLVMTQDGSLLISDDTDGMIYRVSYVGKLR